MSWNLHVDYICARANSRLYFLKLLKRAGLSSDRLVYWYISVVRPVLEYCAVVWNHSLTKYQIDKIEAIQRRAIRIITQRICLTSCRWPMLICPYWQQDAIKFAETSLKKY